MILVVIPAFNEADHLQVVLPSIPDRISEHRVETIVISDGSTDDTLDVARAFGCEALAARVNRGKGATLRLGFQAAAARSFDVLVVMDGDGQHDPSELERLVQPVLAHDADIALGSRYQGECGRAGTPWNRYTVRCATTKLLDRILGQRVTDPYCGFRALSAAAASLITLRGDRYQSELEMLFAAREHGLTLAEVPITKIYGPDTSKMGAHRGAVLGRMSVLLQYCATLTIGSLRLRRLQAGLQVEPYK